MPVVLRYIIGSILLLVAVYFSIKGILYQIRNLADISVQRRRAIYLTIAALIGAIGFEMFYFTGSTIICIPLALVIIWVNYLVAVIQLRSFRK